jgi:ribulose-5-phosphate 4-epimerase/fuculose-1-phosphate aldolase
MPHTELKQTLADAIRMMERAKITDFSGHFSARVPGTEYLMINSAKSVRSALTVDDIVIIDMDGKLVEGADTPPMEFHIHTEIYRRRKDVQAVAHAHAMWSTFFTMAGVPVKPVMPTAAVLGEVRVFPKPDSINYKSIAEEVAEALGERKIILLRSHGAVIAAEGIIEAFVLAAYLEENAYRQYMASQLGDPYVLTEEEIKLMAKNLWKPHLVKKTWDYHYRKLMQE